MELPARDLPSGREAKENSGSYGDYTREQQHTPVDLRRDYSGNISCHPCDENIHQQKRKQRSKRATDHSQYQTFRQELHDDFVPARTDGKTDCNFCLPRCATREKKRADVCAGNQKHQSRRSHQNQQGRSERSEQGFLQRQESRSKIPIDIRILLRKAARYDCHICLCVRYVRIGFEEADDGHSQISPRGDLLAQVRPDRRDQHPYFGFWIGKLEARWHDSRHLITVSVENDRFAYGLGIGSEGTRPERVAQYHGLLILHRCKRLAEQRADAKCFKEIRRHHIALHVLGLNCPHQIERLVFICGEVCEEVVLAPIFEVRIGSRPKVLAGS